MTHNPQVSIIIPSYNRADTVGETIESILAQQCKFDYEIIIGDDCSTDNAREVLQQYADKNPDIIHLIFHEHNVGLGANWALCVKASNGKYICNCDNDDYWHNNKKLQLQVEYMESHPECGMVYTNHRTHNRTTGDIRDCTGYIEEGTSYCPTQQLAFFHGHNSFCNATVMYRAETLKRHVPLDDFVSRQFYLQDWTCWTILSAYTHFDKMEISTATFGVETESITRPLSYEKLQCRFDKELDGYKYICNMFPSTILFDEAGWHSYVNHCLLNLAYRKKDYNKAKEYSARLKGRLNLKVLCARNSFLFSVLCTVKRIKEL